MITYAVVAVLMTAIFTISVDSAIFTKVRQGNIAVDFLRPTNLPVFWFMEDVGRAVSACARFGIPVLVTAAVFIQVPAPSDVWSGLLFLPSSLLSYVLLWQMAALIGLSAFWVTELGNIGRIKDMLVLILSGRLIPLWLFPDYVQTASA